MDDMERRAMLGDEKAQKECTEKGVMLPCPFCKCKVSDLKNTESIKWFWRKCRFCGAESPAQETEFKANWAWNTRTPIPLGRCKDCAYKERAKVNDKGFLICPASGMEITDDDYCSYFEPNPKLEH